MGNSNTKKDTAEPKTDDSSICSFNSLSHPRLIVHEDRREAFCLTWLDEHANSGSLESLDTQTLLRQINHDKCFFFDRPETFLGTDPDLSKQIQEDLAGHIRRYAFLQSKHADVVDICTSHEKLRSSILTELSSSKFRLFENQILRTVIPLNSTDGVANDCIHRSYISFIQLLKEMPRTPQAKETMVSRCEDYCRGQEAAKEMIEHFRKDDTSEKAIDWYIKDSFVHRLINRAFRTLDVSLWYIFRYYIADLCEQIERVHKEQNIRTALTLYRGQTSMHRSELDYLRSNIDCLVSTIGFFSTSTQMDKALEFIFGAVDTEEYKVVLFAITVDGMNLKNTVFVDIEQYNSQTGEGEILFNMGSVFRVEDVSLHQTEPAVWLIKMRATDERTDEIKQNLEKNKQAFRPQLLNLTFGRLLIDMHEYPKAESYFQILIENLPSRHPDLPFVYNQLGDLYMRSANWQEALHQFTKASELQKKSSSICSVTWNNFGNYYKAIGEYTQALQYYTKAWQCQNKAENRMRIQLNMATIASINDEYEKAIDSSVEAHLFFHQVDRRPDDELVHCLGIIADIHVRQKKFQDAEDYYIAAMELAERVLLIAHRLRISAIKSLADLYAKQNRKREAIQLCEDKLASYEHCLPSNHPSIAQLCMKLGELYDDDDARKITSLQRALTIFESSVHLDYAASSECYLTIADCYKQCGRKLAASVLLISHRLRTIAIKLLADLDVRQDQEHEVNQLNQDRTTSYERCFPANLPSIAHLYTKLNELDADDQANKLALLRKGLTMFKSGIHLDYAATSDRYRRMAEYCQQHGFDQAYPYYFKALRIQEKIYPQDHWKVRVTRSMMEADLTQY